MKGANTLITWIIIYNDDRMESKLTINCVKNINLRIIKDGNVHVFANVQVLKHRIDACIRDNMPSFTNPIGSISASVGRIDSKWKSVTQQDGIYAGEEGYNLNVGKRTTLERCCN